MNKESRFAVITIVITIIFVLTFSLVFNLVISTDVYDGCRQYTCTYVVITNYSNCINYSINFDNQNCYQCLSYQVKNSSRCHTNYAFTHCPIDGSCYDFSLRHIQFIVNCITFIIPITLVVILMIIIIKNNKVDYNQVNY